MKNAIFDLDMTIVNSSCLERYRRMRDWQVVYSMVPQCSLYDGMSEVFAFIRANNIQVTIVSTAPRPYIERVVNYFNIPCNFIVGYHDAKPIKPHPAPMWKALQLMSCTASEAISFGDRGIDIQASNAAGIGSVACYWGTSERVTLDNSWASKRIYAPEEIMELLN